MRLKSKIALIVTPLIALPLIAVGIIAYLELWHSSDEQSRIQMRTYLEQRAERYQTRIRSAHFALKSLANDALLKDYLLTEDPEDRYALMQRPMLSKLASIQAANPDFQEIRLLRPDGFEELRMITRNGPNITEEEANSPFFTSIRPASINHSEWIGTNPDTGLKALFVTLPLWLRNNSTEAFTSPRTLRGFLSITQNIDKVIASALPPPWEEGLLLVSDIQGNLLTQVSSSAPLSAPLSDLLSAPFSASLLEQLGQHQPATDLWNKVVVKGTQVLHLSLPLNSDLFLHSLLPERSTLAASNKVGFIVLIVTGFTLAVSIPLLLWFLRYQVLTPIAALNHALITLSKRQERYQITKRSDDEIGDLVNSFNRMSIDLHESNNKIRSLAFLDALTGLPNRLLFRQNLKQAMASTDRTGTLLALLFLDVDNFKQVNDTMGHPIGDLLLQQVAQRLQKNLRDDDHTGLIDHQNQDANFSRLGGDEFTILLPHLDATHNAGVVAERIIAAIAEPFQIDQNQFYIGISIGIAFWPDDGVSAEDLITHADLAMYQAKKLGKNNFQYFSKSIGEFARDQSRTVQRLRRAAEMGGFSLNYQPILDARTLQVVSFEALIRWDDEILGRVPPERFIPLAEEHSLMIPISRWVLNEACLQTRKWIDQGYVGLRVGINMAGIHLSQPATSTEIQNCLLRHRLPPSCIYIELTETSVIEGKEPVIDNLNQLRALGVQIALDDFGTGYSSLSYLRNLPIDVLKIDRSFIQDLGEGHHSVILTAIITMAHALGLKVIAEGVELETDLQILNGEGIDMIQGYLFSQPLAPAAAIAFSDRQKGHLSARPKDRPLSLNA
ncbi:MAG: diguanylate cyclase (GGDEF)-like protein [Motiliproteus sp.]|jgi:diguanylate cyclase (GGDEF)-like protein